MKSKINSPIIGILSIALACIAFYFWYELLWAHLHAGSSDGQYGLIGFYHLIYGTPICLGAIGLMIAIRVSKKPKDFSYWLSVILQSTVLLLFVISYIVWQS